MKSNKEGIKTVAVNRKAHHDYFLVEKLEVGIALLGSEMMPCREGKVTIKDSYAEEENGELWLYDMHIASNPYSNRLDHNPERKRKLLAHKGQIVKMGHKSRTAGMTIIPLRVYLKNGKVKVEIALAKGKAKYDKRESIAKRDAERDAQRVLGGRY